MLIILDLKNKPRECKKCPFGVRGCAVKLLHNCPLEKGVEVKPLTSWAEICGSDIIFGAKQEEQK